MSVLMCVIRRCYFFLMYLMMALSPIVGYCEGGVGARSYYHITLWDPQPSVPGSFQHTLRTYSEPSAFQVYKNRWGEFLSALAENAEHAKDRSVEKSKGLQNKLIEEKSFQSLKIAALETSHPPASIFLPATAKSFDFAPGNRKQLETSQALMRAKVVRTQTLIPQVRDLTNSTLIRSQLEPAALEYIHESMNEAETRARTFEELIGKPEYASLPIVKVSIDFMYAKVTAIRDYLSGLATGSASVIRSKAETLQYIFSHPQFVEQISTTIMNVLTGDAIALNNLKAFRDRATQTFLLATMVLISTAPGDARRQGEIKGALLTELFLDVLIAEAPGAVLGLTRPIAAEFAGSELGSSLADSLLGRANANRAFDIRGKSISNAAREIVDSARSVGIETPEGTQRFLTEFRRIAGNNIGSAGLDIEETARNARNAMGPTAAPGTGGGAVPRSAVGDTGVGANESASSGGAGNAIGSGSSAPPAGAGTVADPAPALGGTIGDPVPARAAPAAAGIGDSAVPRGFSRVEFPRGAGAASGPVPSGYVQVSRWVSAREAQLWAEEGATRIPPQVGTLNGTNDLRLYVTRPDTPRINAWGPIRVDFYMPESALVRGGNTGWQQVIQPMANTPIYNVRILHP